MESLPARERGLKRLTGIEIAKQVRVAPRAGAWIETSISVEGFIREDVAPRAGAWIETSDVAGEDRHRQVAPRAGAWIETLIES